jgi:uncharacterized membrane protein YhaH (DUF805 family)
MEVSLVGLKGRIGRLHYWLLLLVAIIVVFFVAATVGSLNSESEPIQWLAYGILLSSGWPVWSATTRRLRDAGLSPWYGLLPIAIPSVIQGSALLFPSAAFLMGIVAPAVTVAGFIFLGVVPDKRRD